MDAAFDRLIGFELEHASPDEARGRVAVEDRVRQPAGLVHGGVYATMAESLATAGTASAVAGGAEVRALSSTTSFLRPITQGSVHARAVPRHRGRSTWVWEAEITDDEGRLCALVRMTVGVTGGDGAQPR
jgi:uncharacterized protein (TIGR00369 family)